MLLASIFLYLLTVMSRIEFNIEFDSLTKDPSSEIFSSNDIANRMFCLNSQRPAGPKKETVRWQRVHDRLCLILIKQEDYVLKVNGINQLSELCLLMNVLIHLNDSIRSKQTTLLGLDSIREHLRSFME